MCTTAWPSARAIRGQRAVPKPVAVTTPTTTSTPASTGENKRTLFLSIQRYRCVHSFENEARCTFHHVKMEREPQILFS